MGILFSKADGHQCLQQAMEPYTVEYPTWAKDNKKTLEAILLHLNNPIKKDVIVIVGCALA